MPVCFVPWVPVTFWVIVTKKVMFEVPNARMAVICPVPVAICFCAVRIWATPGVAKPRAMTLASYERQMNGLVTLQLAALWV